MADRKWTDSSVPTASSIADQDLLYGNQGDEEKKFLAACFATAAQGAKADSALQPTPIMTANTAFTWANVNAAVPAAVGSRVKWGIIYTNDGILPRGGWMVTAMRYAANSILMNAIRSISSAEDAGGELYAAHVTNTTSGNVVWRKVKNVAISKATSFTGTDLYNNVYRNSEEFQVISWDANLPGAPTTRNGSGLAFYDDNTTQITMMTLDPDADGDIYLGVVQGTAFARPTWKKVPTASDITGLQNQINSLLLGGIKIGSFTNKATVPTTLTSASWLKTPTVNDFFSVWADESEGGVRTQYFVTAVDTTNDTLTIQLDGTFPAPGEEDIEITGFLGADLTSSIPADGETHEIYWAASTPGAPSSRAGAGFAFIPTTAGASVRLMGIEDSVYFAIQPTTAVVNPTWYEVSSKQYIDLFINRADGFATAQQGTDAETALEKANAAQPMLFKGITGFTTTTAARYIHVGAVGEAPVKNIVGHITSDSQYVDNIYDFSFRFRSSSVLPIPVASVAQFGYGTGTGPINLVTDLDTGNCYVGPFINYDYPRLELSEQTTDFTPVTVAGTVIGALTNKKTTPIALSSMVMPALTFVATDYYNEIKAKLVALGLSAARSITFSTVNNLAGGMSPSGAASVVTAYMGGAAGNPLYFYSSSVDKKDMFYCAGYTSTTEKPVWKGATAIQEKPTWYEYGGNVSNAPWEIDTGILPTANSQYRIKMDISGRNNTTSYTAQSLDILLSIAAVSSGPQVRVIATADTRDVFTVIINIGWNEGGTIRIGYISLVTRNLIGVQMEMYRLTNNFGANNAGSMEPNLLDKVIPEQTTALVAYDYHRRIQTRATVTLDPNGLTSAATLQECIADLFMFGRLLQNCTLTVPATFVPKNYRGAWRAGDDWSSLAMKFMAIGTTATINVERGVLSIAAGGVWTYTDTDPADPGANDASGTIVVGDTITLPSNAGKYVSTTLGGTWTVSMTGAGAWRTPAPGNIVIPHGSDDRYSLIIVSALDTLGPDPAQYFALGTMANFCRNVELTNIIVGATTDYTGSIKINGNVTLASYTNDVASNYGTGCHLDMRVNNSKITGSCTISVGGTLLLAGNVSIGTLNNFGYVNIADSFTGTIGLVNDNGLIRGRPTGAPYQSFSPKLYEHNIELTGGNYGTQIFFKIVSPSATLMNTKSRLCIWLYSNGFRGGAYGSGTVVASGCTYDGDAGSELMVSSITAPTASSWQFGGVDTSFAWQDFNIASTLTVIDSVRTLV